MKRDVRHDHAGGYEPFEQRARPVLLFALGLALVTGAVLLLMKLAHDALDRSARAGDGALHPLAAEREVAPEPRLQATPGLDLARMRERERARLSTYGWVDRQAGVVHIPIERAMEIVAREGLPVRDASGR